MGERHGDRDTTAADEELLHRLRRLASERRHTAGGRAVAGDTPDDGELTDADLAALAHLLGAVAPTHRTPDPAREEAALAAFRAARDDPTSRPRLAAMRRRWARRAAAWRTGRRGRTTLLGVVVAALLGGGAAVAADVPLVPGWGDGAARRPGPGASASPRPDVPRTPAATPHRSDEPSRPSDSRDGDTPPEGADTAHRLSRLCRAYLRQPAAHRQEALRAARFAPLVERAGGAARVPAPCRTAPRQDAEPPRGAPGHGPDHGASDGRGDSGGPAEGAPGHGSSGAGRGAANGTPGNADGNPGAGDHPGPAAPSRGHPGQGEPR